MNAYIDKCKNNDFSIGFDSRSEFSFTDGTFGKKSHYHWT